jgi:single-strand DNA-binding protein
VEGRLKLDQWDDKQTREKKSKLGVVGETIQFLAASDKGSSGQVASPAANPAPERGGEPLAGDGPPESDDVPF